MFGHCASVHLIPGIICSLQAGLLAQQDSFAPFIWVAVQSVLNVVGDLVLIMYFKQGLAGAAWATVVSQLVGTIGLVWMYSFRGQVMPHKSTSACFKRCLCRACTGCGSLCMM